VNAIVHAHPPWATALALAGTSLPAESMAELAVTFGHLPLVPYATPGTMEVGLALQTALGQAWGALLERHGAITLGSTPEDAAARMERLERGAQTWVLARLLLGKAPPALDAAQIAAAKRAMEARIE
jgi:L-fuculose-phosphate aldolase